MGSISVQRKDGSSHVVRTSKKTRFVRLAHEAPVYVNLAALGDTPALSELFLSTSSVIDALDLSPLAKHPALTSLTATIARAPDLTPLASTKLTSLSITLDGKGTLDFRPLHGHPTLEDLELGFVGTQKKLDLSFLRELPALTTLTIDGGDWKTLDLSPLEGLPLRSFTLVRQYIKKVDLALLAQPALEELDAGRARHPRAIFLPLPPRTMHEAALSFPGRGRDRDARRERPGEEEDVTRIHPVQWIAHDDAQRRADSRAGTQAVGRSDWHRVRPSCLMASDGRRRRSRGRSRSHAGAMRLRAIEDGGHLSRSPPAPDPGQPEIEEPTRRERLFHGCRQSFHRVVYLLLCFN